jgi:TrmH family RNA methyltransferase
MTTKKIQSTRNPVVKEALEIKEKRTRFKHRAFLIEGPHLLESALMSERCRIMRFFYTEAFGKKNPRLCKKVLDCPAELYEVGEHVLGRLSDTEAPQGVVVIASYRQPEKEVLRKGGIIVVLDGVQDPGNTGTIVRTAEAAGAKAVVLLPGTCDPFSPKAIRASAGSVLNVPILYENRNSLVDKLKRFGIPLVVTIPSDRRSLFDAVLRPPLALAFGNESRGISPALRKAASLSIMVPIKGRAESLNVASTAAICIYEALRQSKA